MVSVVGNVHFAILFAFVCRVKPPGWFRFGSHGGVDAADNQSGSHVASNDSRLMRDLENDCVDRDIYDEEIRCRQNHEPTLVTRISAFFHVCRAAVLCYVHLLIISRFRCVFLA
jgi:hypothetical protein